MTTTRKVETSGDLGSLSAIITVQGHPGDETAAKAAGAGAEAAHGVFGNAAQRLSMLAEPTDAPCEIVATATMTIGETIVEVMVSFSFASDPSLVSIAANEAVYMIGRSVVATISPINQVRLMQKMAAANPMAFGPQAQAMQMPPAMPGQQMQMQPQPMAIGMMDDNSGLGQYL